jgi:hypothetical protein
VRKARICLCKMGHTRRSVTVAGRDTDVIPAVVRVKQGVSQTFRALTPFELIHKEGEDGLLNELCGRNRCKVWAKRPDKEIYNLQHDFPILRSRIATLNYHLSSRKPRTWKDLWRDKRDLAQCFIFWAVLIIGGFGLLFSFIQVVLQMVQLAISTNP